MTNAHLNRKRQEREVNRRREMRARRRGKWSPTEMARMEYSKRFGEDCLRYAAVSMQTRSGCGL